MDLYEKKTKKKLKKILLIDSKKIFFFLNLGIGIFNPILSFLAISLLPMHVIHEDLVEGKNAVLYKMALATNYGGEWLGWVVGIDAFVVLAGSVLTAYVGVIGLVRRMAMDRCLPEFLLQENKLRGTNHWIILGFFGLTSSLMLITNGNTIILGGVYTTAFLSVMALFAGLLFHVFNR